MKKQLGLTLMILVAVLLYGCTPTITGNVVEQDTVTFGAILPMSGDGAVYGEAIKNGIELAVEEVNAAGGVKDSKLVIDNQDNALDPKAAVNIMNKFVSVDRYPVVVSVSSGSTLAVCPIAENSKTVLMTIASSPDVTNCGDYTFRVAPSDSFQGIKMAEIAEEKGFDKVAIIYINNAYGAGLAEAAKKSVIENGGNVVLFESLESGQSDFRTQLTKLKQRSPDVLFLPVYLKEGSLLLNQMDELDINVPVIGSETLMSSSLLETAGDAAQGMMVTWVKESTEDAKKIFDEKYLVKYGPDAPKFYSDYYYDAVYILAEAYAKSDGSAESFKDAMYQTNFAGTTWTTTFDSNGDVMKPFGVYQVKGESFIELE